MNNASTYQLRTKNSDLGLSFGSDASLRSLIASATPEEKLVLPTRTNTSLLRGPVFVVGCPRSGTTVLGKCLSSHSKLAGAEESLFLLDIWRIILDLHQGQNSRSWGPLREYLSLQQLIEASGNFADCIFGGLVAQLNKAHLIEHTPWYVALLPLLRSLYPDCRVLHLLRDGRDVVASLSTSFEKGFSWAGESIAARTLLWRLLVNVGQRDANQFPSDQYREWKYEQLCESPRQTMHEILDWLGLIFEESTLHPLAVQHAGPSRSGATLAAVDESGRLDIQSRVVGGKWPIHWTNEDRAVFADIGDELLTKLNYTVLPATKQIDNKQ
jgi:Sulfotransferase family